MLRTLKPEFRIAASAALLQRGCVHVIGLDEIKAEIGPIWEKRKGSAWAHLENLLQQKLGPTDFFFRIDDTSFLVSMPSATEEEAQTFCVSIAHDLHTNLLGPCEIGKLKVSRATSTQDDTIKIDPLTVQQLTSLARLAGLQGEVGASAVFPVGKPPSGQPPPNVDFLHRFVPL